MEEITWILSRHKPFGHTESNLNSALKTSNQTQSFQKMLKKKSSSTSYAWKKTRTQEATTCITDTFFNVCFPLTGWVNFQLEEYDIESQRGWSCQCQVKECPCLAVSEPLFLWHWGQVGPSAGWPRADRLQVECGIRSFASSDEEWLVCADFKREVGKTKH